jgi:hypothetical protein
MWGADHARFLEGQWLRTYDLTFSNPAFAEGTARLFGTSSADQVKQEAVLTYLNIARLGLITLANDHAHEVRDERHSAPAFCEVFGKHDTDPPVALLWQCETADRSDRDEIYGSDFVRPRDRRTQALPVSPESAMVYSSTSSINPLH